MIGIRSDFYIKTTPYLAFTSKLWDVYWQYCIETWSCDNEIPSYLNSLRPGKTYVHRWTEAPLVQVMAIRLLGAKPFC